MDEPVRHAHGKATITEVISAKLFDVAMLEMGETRASPILLGLTVMGWRVRYRCVSSANPHFPGAAQRALEGVAVRVLMSRSRPGRGLVTGMPMPAPS
jgi:hypothetical protein